jgi:hypothetical protein
VTRIWKLSSKSKSGGNGSSNGSAIVYLYPFVM